MLSPSSPAHKVPGEEDSSGSDAGSEVAVEPETDRFGFIVTNGSTAGSVGPPPELVRQREAKWINIISQWDRILMKKTSKVKVQCQKGIPASLRAKCWPLLCGATDRMKFSDKLYQRLDSEPALQSWVDVIERDLDRQFPFHEMFLSKDGHGQRGLFRVLKAYTQHQPEEGYCQAQGPVAAVLLMNMPAEEAFWCLVQISEQYLPGYYSPLLEGVLFDAAMLTWVLKRTCPAAHKHLQHHGVEPLMFATDWLMCLFTRHLPFNTLLRVWDLFFCYGVRVLLQVAVVLVRRVLGRAEQRKQCQGQMETLERLRGVREEVQEGDDSFIAEVCSVQLSAKDLEKQTEKELQKWRKDRPSSTFDPRGRCHGYRMAWTRARLNEEERDKTERQKGNLSVPLTRSVSALSLSPSLLHKRWRKGGKVITSENEGGVKVKRHLSMGANEDYRSWTELHVKKVQDVEEEVSEDDTKQSETKDTEQKNELLKDQKEMDKIENVLTEHVEERDTVKEHTEVERRVTEKENSQIKETEENKMLSQQTEEPTQDQALEVFLHPTEHVFHPKEVNEPDSDSQPQVQEQIESKDLETVAKDSSKKTEKQVEESEQTSIVEGNQTEIQKDADHMKTAVEMLDSVNTNREETIQPEETGHAQQTQTEIVTEEETPSKTSPDPKTNQGATVETDTQEEVITQEDAAEGKYHSIESLAELDMKEGSHTLTETQTDQLALTQEKMEENVATPDDSGAEVVQTDRQTEEQIDSEACMYSKTEAEILIVCSPEGREQEEDADPVAEAETEVEIPVASQAFPPCLEEEIDTEPMREKVEIILTLHSQVQVNYEQTQADEETQTESETNEKTNESLEVTSAESEAVDLATEHDGEVSSEEKTTTTTSEPMPEEPKDDSLVVALAESEAGNLILKHDGKISSEEKSTAKEPEPDEPKDESLEVALAESEAGELATEHDGKASLEEKTTSEPVPEEPKEESVGVALAESEKVDFVTEPDGKVSSEEKSTAEETVPEEPKLQLSMDAVEKKESTENIEENTVGENGVFISTEITDSANAEGKQQDPHFAKDQKTETSISGLKQVSVSSGDLCVRRPSGSRGSRLGRRLSEDLFIVPQKINQTQSISNHPEDKEVDSRSNPGVVQTPQTSPHGTSEVTTDPPKRFGLFRRLRGEQPKKTKMQVPKILIQDFSDETGKEKTVKEDGEEKLSSRERRRRRRERERREKEEERVRKKREKELEKEKERERRKPNTRGKSFQGQSEKGNSDVSPAAKMSSQTHRNSVSYSESYF